MSVGMALTHAAGTDHPTQANHEDPGHGHGHGHGHEHAHSHEDHDHHHHNTKQNASLLDVFLFGRPWLFFKAVEVLELYMSFYIAVTSTQVRIIYFLVVVFLLCVMCMWVWVYVLFYIAVSTQVRIM